MLGTGTHTIMFYIRTVYGEQLFYHKIPVHDSLGVFSEMQLTLTKTPQTKLKFAVLSHDVINFNASRPETIRN